MEHSASYLSVALYTKLRNNYGVRLLCPLHTQDESYCCVRLPVGVPSQTLSLVGEGQEGSCCQ